MSRVNKSEPFVRVALAGLLFHGLVAATAEAEVIANFTFFPANPVAGEIVQFTDTSTGNPTNWQWDFENPPNGTDSTLQNPTWTFNDPGTYPVELVAFVPPSDIDVITINVVVSAPGAGELSFTSSSYQVDEGSGLVGVTVQRTSGSEGPVGVDCNTADGTALAGSDYTGIMQTLTWADGDITDKNCVVPIIDDTVVEGDETVVVSLTNVTGGATLGTPNIATLTIIDDDLFRDEFESGDTCEWSAEVPGPQICVSRSLGDVRLRVVNNTSTSCDAVQLAPAVATGSVRLKHATSGKLHLELVREDIVVLEADVSTRTDGVFEILGLELAPYEIVITAEDRSTIRNLIDLTATMPCAAFEIDH